VSHVTNDNDGAHAGITLCITVLDDSASLPRFLSTLHTQRRRPDNVIVVDGGSTDGTVDVLHMWTPPVGTTVRVIVSPGANISVGRNIAICAAQTEWVAVTDAGTRLSPRWLELLSREMNDGNDVVSGFFEPAGHTTMGSIIGAATTPLLSEIDERQFLPSSRSIAFRRAAWLEAGGYPEWLDYCEDLVFDLALRARGARFSFVGAAVVHWEGRERLSSFAQQYYRYARGDGKAGLWVRRHLIRYVAYSLGAASVVGSISRRSPLAVMILLPLGLTYLWSTWRRVRLHLNLSRNERRLGYVLTPVIVFVGDAAKMAGYPAGIVWRRRHRSTP
jgi:glycosyltransferase involved in cell wall biosynthesis